jgi:VWFA-related protein
MAGLRAQGPNENVASAPMPRMHAEETQIILDLVARDKKNRPVVNLNAADLSVTDGGKPVQLSGLHLVTAQSRTATRIAILFDVLSPESAKVARDFIDKLMAAAPEQSEFAVLGSDRGLRLLKDYTTDRAATLAATQLVPNGIPQNSLADAEKTLVSEAQNGTLENGANASVEDRANAKIMLSALEDSQKIVEDQHIPAGLAGMMALSRAQQNVAGRKVILFFSEGLRPSSKTEDFTKDVVEAANRAGVSIYTVDTRGVAAKSFNMLTMVFAPPSNSSVGQTPGVAGMITQAPIRFAPDLATNPLLRSVNPSAQNDLENAKGDPLVFLAGGTGGFAMSTGDDLRKPLRRLVADIGSYYEASYTPALNGYDGQFHPLEIHAVRTGITVRSRSGYFALPPDATGSAPVRPSEAPLLKLLSDAQPPSDIAFDQAVLELDSGGSGKDANEAAVEVPLAHLELRRDQQTMLYSARATVLAEVKDAHGVVVQRFHEDFSRNGALESIDVARNGVFTLQRHFAAAPGKYELESVVVDQIAGKAGAQRTEFTVPEPAKAPWLSDVVLVRHMQPVNGAPDLSEPMLYEKARVVPNLDHRVATGTAQVSFLVRMERESTGPDGVLTLDVERDGKTVTHSTSKIAAGTGSNSTVDLATIQAGNLPPGAYRARFTLAQGDRSASRELMFTLDGDAGGKPRSDEADEDTTDVPANLDAGEGRFSPATASNPPSDAFRRTLLDGARERANSYLESLVNFKCIQVTDRYVDHRGDGKAHHDKIAELLTYENHHESRQLLEVNGIAGSDQHVDMAGARLEGALGGVLQIVFDAKSEAKFDWQQRGSLDGAAVEVFNYRVDEQHSRFSVTPLPAPSRLVPFHGQVFIDAATRGVRRITIEAEGIPADSPIHASSLSIDYDYVTMNDHDYLVPARGEMRMQLGKREKIFHQIEFRDYHRFGSQLRIVSVNP